MRFNAVALGLAVFLFASPLAAQTGTPPPYGAPITPGYSWSSTDNDFNDLVVEIKAASPVGVETANWGSVNALFRQ